jgi:protein-disulfide isomerase
VLVLAAVGGGLGVALSGGSAATTANVPAHGSLTGRLTLPNAAAVQRLFAGIPQRANVLGSSSAPVTMVEYIDLQCPYCDAFELQVLPDLLTRYVRPGTLRIEARPLAFIGPDSDRGRLGAIAAAGQNRMFNYMELLYANQGSENTGWLDDSMVARAAASIPGLDVTRLLTARTTQRVKTSAARFDGLAARDAVRGTPTLYVGRTGETLHQVTLASPTDEASVAAAVDAARG